MRPLNKPFAFGCKKEPDYIRDAIPVNSSFAGRNGDIFYLLYGAGRARGVRGSVSGQKNIQSEFHYLSLLSNLHIKNMHDGLALLNADRSTETLLQLTLQGGLQPEQVERIGEAIINFFRTFNF